MTVDKPTHAQHGGKSVAKRAATPVNPYDYSDTMKSPQWKMKVVPTDGGSAVKLQKLKQEVAA